MTKEEFIKKLEADKNAQTSRWANDSEAEYHRAKRREELKKEFGITE